jgi:hypothetical protein
MIGNNRLVLGVLNGNPVHERQWRRMTIYFSHNLGARND